MGDSKRDRARWPLSFQMSPTGHRFWSHNLYRGPQDQPVRVLYSRTKLESDEIAHEFLSEKVVGFDMEWPWDANNTDARLQQRIGLIQIACEDKIALFHIGLHSGSTAKDLLAPSLRKLIEDPAIAKCGVAVHNADFARLQQWFGLKPCGAFELSHLHNLVTHGASSPTKCTTKLKKLAVQVEQHLGIPLFKGKVRTSNWSEPLSKDQVNYAAADAYAGFMLYHCMNAKRAAMDPTPPLPVYAETYRHTFRGQPPKQPLQLAPVDGDVAPLSVLHFYKTLEDAAEDQSDAQSAEGEAEPRQRDQAAADQEVSCQSNDDCEYVRIGRRGKHVLFAKAADVGVDVIQQLRDQHAAEQQRAEIPAGTSPPKIAVATSKSSKAKRAAPAVESGILDETRTELLFRELRNHRRDLAKERECPPFVIAHDSLLHAISRKCPRRDVELLRIKGIGKKKAADCGAAWLAIVRNFVEKSDIDGFGANDGGPQCTSAVPAASQPENLASQVNFDEPARSTPSLHTGISFSMQNASLDHEKYDQDVVDDLDDDEASNDELGFAIPRREPSPSFLKRKRDEADADQKSNSMRPRQPQRRHQAIAEGAKLPPQPSPAVTITPLPQLLSTLPRKDSESTSLLLHSPCADRESTLAAQDGTRTTALAPAGQLPPDAMSKIHPIQRSAVKPGIDPLPTARQLNASELQCKILRNKIIAFNKLVTTTVQLPVSTIEHLVHQPPRTMEELLKVPGIMPFANACSRANRDLLGFLVKSAPATR